MFTLSMRQQWFIAACLMCLMAITRGHHYFDLSNLPSASLAVFFLAGFYIPATKMLPLLVFEAAFLDYSSFLMGGSSHCLSPSYVMMIPAYAVIWYAGVWCKKHYAFNGLFLLKLTLSVLIASVISKIISGASFYFLSGRYAEPQFAEYLVRFVKYYPNTINNISFYLVIAIVIHSVVVLVIDVKARARIH